MTDNYAGLVERLHGLHNDKRLLKNIGGQMMGCEGYRLVASGNDFYTLLEAADAIEALVKERDQLRAEHATMQKMLRQMQDLATDRGIELARVREDAERYRWLRSTPFDAALAGKGEGEKP